jgi:hypothetical protein
MTIRVNLWIKEGRGRSFHNDPPVNLRITFDATVDNLNKMIYIHPALQEITMGAVRTALENIE